MKLLKCKVKDSCSHGTVFLLLFYSVLALMKLISYSSVILALEK